MNFAQRGFYSSLRRGFIFFASSQQVSTSASQQEQEADLPTGRSADGSFSKGFNPFEKGSRNFAARNSYMAYKDMPFGRCAFHLVLATVIALINISPKCVEGERDEG